MTRISRAVALSLSALIAAASLAACGIKGDLKTPPPVFGSDKVAKPLPKAPVEGQVPSNTPE